MDGFKLIATIAVPIRSIDNTPEVKALRVKELAARVCPHGWSAITERSNMTDIVVGDIPICRFYDVWAEVI